MNDTSNYRGIALNNPLGKVFELSVLCKHRQKLCSSDMQFGYNKGLPTSSCTFVVKEMIQECLNGYNDIHVTLLDSSKAFDTVHYVTLFRRLIRQGICPLICRILLHMHVFQNVQIR